MLKLGLIGLSEGNGHPYSWAAIFNGYDKKAMEHCGFPVIPRYLEQQSWPKSQIPGALVTSVWTQKEAISEHIAKSAHIERIELLPEDMLGRIDALLLARDDAKNHWRFAAPFLKAGIPVYIDKPIALSVAELNNLYELQSFPGQIFTCSAMRYSKELILSDFDREIVGDIKQIVACTPKSWEKYAVHIIEPVLKLLPSDDEVVSHKLLRNQGEKRTLSVFWKSGIATTFSTLGENASPVMIKVIGTLSDKELVFTDSFQAFKSALSDFVEGVEERSVKSSSSFNKAVVDLIEKGGE
tara:strand:- start:35627 stop:36517 length:891 start_codon:yes stop_codon:yes gene_type:complete